jgi:hypothetical protein
MATAERGAKALVFTGSGSIATEIATLRNAIQAGNTVRASDLNSIATLINNMNGHYHTYDDAYQLATYGNNGDRNNYYRDVNTSGPDAATSAPTNTTANTAISASRHNELRDAINQIRSHYHTVDDRTS